eukprot:463715_1
MGNYFDTKTDKGTNKKKDNKQNYYEWKLPYHVTNLIINEVTSYSHVAQHDSDVVLCTHNEWNSIVNKAKGVIQRQLRQSSNILRSITETEAINSLDSETKDNKDTYNTFCNKLFHKTTPAKDNNETRIKSKYRCDQCFTRLEDNSNIFMCNEHRNILICSLCHGYRAETQIYHKILDKMGQLNKIDNTKKINTKMKKHYELLLKKICAEYPKYKINVIATQIGQTVTYDAKIKLNQILTNYNNHICDNIPTEVCELIALFIGKYDLIKIDNNKSLLNLFDIYWSLQCLRTTPIHAVVDQRYARFGHYNLVSTAFTINKIDMKISDFEAIQNDIMYKKFIAPNSKCINFEEFKNLSINAVLFDKNEDDDKLLLLGDILSVLCDDNMYYSFDGLVLKVVDYSYLAHPHYPGGPGQMCGNGYFIIFRIGDSQQNEHIYMIMSYCSQGIGM